MTTSSSFGLRQRQKSSAVGTGTSSANNNNAQTQAQAPHDDTQHQEKNEKEEDTTTTTPRSSDDGRDNRDRHRHSSSWIVEGGYVLTPLQRRPWFTRLDVLPFMLAYGICIVIEQYSPYWQWQSSSSSSLENNNVLDHSCSSSSNAATTSTTTTAMTAETVISLLLPLTLLLHLGLVVWQQWNISVKCKVGYTVEPNFHKWTHVLVQTQQSQTQQTVGENTQSSGSSGDGGLPTVQRPAPNVAVVTYHHVVFRYENNQDDCNAATVTTTNSSSSTMLRRPWTKTTTTATTSAANNNNNNYNSKLSSSAVATSTTTTSQDPSSPTTLPPPSSSSSDAATTTATAVGGSDALSTTSTTTTGGFHRLHYPIDLKVDFYGTWKGHTTLDDIQTCENIYGSNTTILELPTFTHLLGQQLVAPFFLFQLFCVVLWSLDDYWYYALYTLVALLLFESTVAYNRLKGMERLRSSMRHPTNVFVYRCCQWMVVSSSELVPGDVVSLSGSSSSSSRQRGRQQQQHQQANVIPADILLLPQGGGGSGATAVVDEALLTGESVPQLKTVLDASSSSTSSTASTQQQQQQQQHLHVDEYKQNILFGGTVLVSHTRGDSSTESTTTSSLIPPPPDRGIVGFCLRTGFETAQGSLLRTMAYSSHNSVDGIHTRDTFYFVGLLLICAVGSAMIVLHEGWKDETRNQFRLLLHVVIIITSVVPPELPMELSLAVTNSVSDLIHKCRVYCTEPFRIPWAGQVNVCCFDKTGTLTSDEMQFKGVQLLTSSSSETDGSSSSADLEELVHPLTGRVPWETVRVMAACHSLACRTGPLSSKASATKKSGNAVIGDPLEAAVLRETGYELQRNDVVVAKDSSNGLPQTIQICHRFAFSSRLKRMTVLVTEDNGKTVRALTKGAPETIQTMLEQVPENYEQVYTHYMGRGQRVLAMGYRQFDGMSAAKLKDKGRGYVEQNFVFAGFLVLDCPLKSDSKSVITELRKSGHKCVMITGDAVLTAAEVARQVGIVRKKTKVTYVLQEKDPLGTDGMFETAWNGVMSKFEFVPLSVRKVAKSSVDAVPALDSSVMNDMIESNEASFCVTGTVLAKVASTAVDARHKAQFESTTPRKDETTILFDPAAQVIMKDLVPFISVFARHAPRQKEAVIAAFNLNGKYTLMCGDGTNDVGALKRAHVGISIISAPEIEAKQRKAATTLQKKKKKKQQRATTLEESLRQLQEAQDELDHVELGDASVASPFTSRAMSIKCCKDVLQQGRCTLVTMLQIYKILGVNCLVNALVLTKLHMHGVKQGDRQLTILGLAVAALFFFVTRGKPLPTLSAERPPSSVLCVQALLSIAAQFMVHLSVILLATESALAFVDPYDPSMIPDGSFNANVLNTCTFLVTMVATVNTFLVNYKGRPFMEDFRDNKMLLRGVQICHAVIWTCALEAFPPLNDLFQLAPFPQTDMVVVDDDEWILSIAQAGGLTQVVRTIGFPAFMCCLLATDTVFAYSVEKGIARLFS